MANLDKKIYELPDLGTVTGDEEFPVTYKRKNYNVNISQIAEYLKETGATCDCDMEAMTDSEVDSLFDD